MAALKCMNTNFLKHIFNRLKALKKTEKLHLSQLCVYISIKIKRLYPFKGFFY